MPIAILRVVYFLGPVACLAIVLMKQGRKLAWWLWGGSAVIIAIHWYSFLSATADNAEKISTLWVSVWTPLLLTTLVAGLTGAQWRGWHSNKNIERWVAALVCIIPSLAAFIIFS